MLGLLVSLPLCADQVRFDTARDWQQWRLPLGAVELTPDGTVTPVFIRKSPNAVLDAGAFGGSIRNAGSNLDDASLVMDGDRATGWAPDPETSPDDWFIEVDLGRGVSANSVTLVFDDEALPFELFDLQLSTGEPEVDVVKTPVPGTVVYRISERFKENKLHRVTFVIEQPGLTPIQYVRFKPVLHTSGARLVEIDVEALGDNVALGLLERGGTLDVNINLASNNSQPLGNSLALVDGDLFKRWRTTIASRGLDDILGHMLLDLGAVYWLDQVRIIGGVMGPRIWALGYYEVMTSDGSLAPDGSFIWTRHFFGEAPAHLRASGLVDHHFDLIPARYVRIVWRLWDTNCFSFESLGGTDGNTGTSRVPGCGFIGTTAEIQLFGQGHPQQVSFRSPLIDLAATKNVNSVEWAASVPSASRVEIRTRTGDELVETYTFYDKNTKEVTEKKYNKLIPSFRGRIDTTSLPGADWSPWSELYSVTGARFQSPSPRRYMEVDIRLVSNSPGTAAALDFFAVNFSSPLAQRTAGEIYPLESQPGEPTQFSYFLRAEQTDGFDELEVEVATPLRFVDVLIEGESLSAESEATATGIRVVLSNRIRSGELLELRFESSIFLQSTRFDVFLRDSRQAEDVRQRIDPGDATNAVESSTNVVQLPVSRALFANMELNSTVITPNGDGINDELLLTVDLINVLEPRLLSMRFFDLAGRLVYTREEEQRNGRQQFTWDSRNGAEQRVVPGIYILELHAGGDAADRVSRRLVSVAY